MTCNFVASINNPGGDLSTFIDSLKSIKQSKSNVRGSFVLAIASTETSDIPGISAAGATPEMRRQTPAADAEALVLGKTASGERLPASPAGIVSPVVITRAALSFLSCSVTVVDCGSFIAPKVPCLTAGTKPARCLSTGSAIEFAVVDELFQAGLQLGKRLSDEFDYLILAECVPGGTTTALGILTALGHKVERLVSSSLPQANYGLRSRLVANGLRNASLSSDALQREPLKAVASVGDPMQPTVCGIALSAAQKIPVVLAGGSQMLAVWALIKAVLNGKQTLVRDLSLAVITTKWVAFDQGAGLKRLSSLVGAPFAASCPNFSNSRHHGLRAYEDGHVKEGAGAGGSLAAARLVADASPGQIMAAVDASYDELVGRTDV